MDGKVIPIRPQEPELVSLYQKQAKVYPRAVSGWFARWRWAMVWITQLVFYGLPWLQWNGRPLMLFDLEQRRFNVFGLTLFPQDFIFLTALLVIAALSLFFFTAVAGRLWCGFACPQTVYTEIFMWVEKRFEGDRVARMRLDAAPNGPAKIARKTGKHLAWAAIGLFTGFTFVGYFTPIGTLARDLAGLRASPWEWFWVLFYGAATYGNAGWMREQMCKYLCPYARFQSALIDRDSLVIAYDTQRGEARGARRRGSDARALGLGDCVDCKLCVQVCPTGIDIRNGLQNECIGCAACIDVCNQVMDKMGSPRGLIRYATENGVAGGWSRARMLRRVLRARTWLYGGGLAAVCAVFVASVALRSPFHVEVLKDRNLLGRETDAGTVENVYRVKVLNASAATQRYRVTATGLPGLAAAEAAPLQVPPSEIGAETVRLVLAAESVPALRGKSSPMSVEVSDERGTTIRHKAVFYVPR